MPRRTYKNKQKNEAMKKSDFEKKLHEKENK